MDLESEQTEITSYGTGGPPNDGEGNRVNSPWTDCVVERKSDDISSVVVQRDGSEVEFNKLTICENEHSIVYSGTDGRNSDIADMSDFSEDEDESQVESRPEPRTGSDCDGSMVEQSCVCDRPITNTVNKLMICESEHSMVYSGTDGRNSDIAAMSDFSDDEDETQVEFRPGPRTGSDCDGSIEEQSCLRDRPITNTVTAGEGHDSLDPNDMEYWTKFRRLTRQAFLLDDDCLSDSNYPDAVKEVVRRSRLTIMSLNEYDAPPFEELTDCVTPGCSDWEDILESDESEGEDSEWRILEHTAIPVKAADNVDRTVTNRNNNRGRCSVPEGKNDTTSDENYSTIDRPFTNLTMAGPALRLTASVWIMQKVMKFWSRS